MRTPIHLEISPKHLKTLETIANSGKSEVDQALRAKILLKKAQGLSNATIASDLAVNRHTIELWVKRYQNRNENDSLDDVLRVAEGRGAKSEIFGEAKTWIIAEACTRPNDLGYAVELWTYSALTKHIRSKAVEAGFPRLATISRNEVYTILEKSRIKPFKIKYYCEKKIPTSRAKCITCFCCTKSFPCNLMQTGCCFPQRMANTFMFCRTMKSQ